MEEIEVKFLTIDPQKMQEKLVAIGAKKVFEKTYRRRVFDYPDLRLHKDGAWLRLRDEGEKITLSYKHRLGQKTHDGTANDESMVVIEVSVDDFEKTALLLQKIGFAEKHYIENRRVRYVLGEVEFDIDTYPRLDPYLEIEAPTWEEVDRAIELLGLNPQERKIFSTYQIYKLKGIDLNDYQILTFEQVAKKEGL